MKGRLVFAVICAAAMWFFMFSPWTGGLCNFWLAMSCAALLLLALALCFTPDRAELLKVERPLLQLLLGIALAFALWSVFWVGDKLSRAMFDFARPQVDSIYAIKDGTDTVVISLLLIFLIGPAEELFWRGFVQRTFGTLIEWRNTGPFAAFLITALIYALVHVWSFNFMLAMAALVAGAIWGVIYMLNPRLLPALTVSHALWDALVFVIFPI